MNGTMRSRWVDVAVALGLGALVLWLYLPTLGYGIWWDDPITFSAGADRPLWELLGGLSGYPYFRPLTYLFRRIWWRDGVLDAPAIHAAQVFFHLLAVMLTWLLARTWTGSRVAAALAALIFAVLPFGHQAVSWTATPQVMLTLLILASVLAYTRFRTGGRAWRWLVVSLGTYAAALFTQEAAAPLCLLFPLIERWPPRTDAAAPARVRWSLGHLALAGVYFMMYAQADRQTGHSGWSFQPEVSAYLLQAVALPMARLAAFVAAWDVGQTAVGWLALFLVVWLAVVWALAQSGHRRLALVASTWIALVLAVPWALLDWEYVMIAPRLVYPAAPAIAMLWAMLVALALAPDRRPMLRRSAAVATLFILGLSVWDLRAQDRLLAVGARHLGAAVAVQADPSQRLVFINFPDRYAMRRAPYPLGYWGVTLAPVVQSLSDYAVTLKGRGARTSTWSMPQVDDAGLKAWPYQADLRGIRLEWPALVAEAGEADWIYLSRYLPDGTLRLDAVGGFRPPESGLVSDFGPARLLAARLSPADQEARAELQLTWHRGPSPGPDLDDTVFVHVVDEAGRPLLTADGDSWGGLVPPKAWPADRAVLDLRTLELSGLAPGRYAVRVGLYNRRTGARYPATGPDGLALPDGAVTIGELTRQ